MENHLHGGIQAEVVAGVVAEEEAEAAMISPHSFQAGDATISPNTRFDKSNIECYRSHGYGHYKYECTANLNLEKNQNSNFVELEEEILLMACLDKEEAQSTMWYLDSGCSNHMCGNKSLFSDLDKTFQRTVKLGNNTSMSVMRKENIKLQLKNNIVHVISSVLYVPELKSNLISLGQLQEKGYTITFQSGYCQIHHPKKGLIVEVNMTANRIFQLQIQTNDQTCFYSKMKDSTWLWHFRYEHLNFGGLKTLQQKNMVTGLPQIHCPSQIYAKCVVGKQHRDPFPKGKAWRVVQPLQLVHSDICVPITPTSNSEKEVLHYVH